MKEYFEKILAPFKILPLGWYRLILAGWLLYPIIISFLFYFIISVFGDADVWYNVSESSTILFVILLLVYYPIARIILWVFEGFKQDLDIKLEHENVFLKEIKSNRNGIEILLSLRWLYQKGCFTTMSSLKMEEVEKIPYIIFILGDKRCNLTFDDISRKLIMKNYQEGDSIIELLSYSFLKLTLGLNKLEKVKIIINSDESFLRLTENYNATKFEADQISLITNYFKAFYK